MLQQKVPLIKKSSLNKKCPRKSHQKTASSRNSFQTAAKHVNSERSGPTSSSSFAPAKKSVCVVEESLFDPSRSQAVPLPHSPPLPHSLAAAPRTFNFRISSSLCRNRASNP